jgi:hypothetical protein
MRTGHAMLLLDTYSVHRMQTVQEAIQALNCDTIFIPGGLTPILQPLDISVNKPVKDYIRDAYSRWARNTFNVERGLARPERKDVATWLSQAWNLVSIDTIKNGFSTAGLQIIQ